MRELEWNPIPKSIGAAPDKTERTQPCLVEHLKSIKIWINSFSSFKVKDDCHNAFLEAVFQFVIGTNNFDLSLRLRFKPEEASSHRDSPLLSEDGVKGWKGANFISGLRNDQVLFHQLLVRGIWRKDGEKAPGKSSAPG